MARRGGTLRGKPLTLALPLAKRLKVVRIAGDAVIVNVLVIGHIGDLSIAAHAESAGGALIDVFHFDFLPGQLWLAKPVVKQLRRYVAIFLADFDVEPFGVAVYDAGLGPCLARCYPQQCCQPDRAH